MTDEGKRVPSLYPPILNCSLFHRHVLRCTSLLNMEQMAGLHKNIISKNNSGQGDDNIVFALKVHYHHEDHKTKSASRRYGDVFVHHEHKLIYACSIIHTNEMQWSPTVIYA